MRTITVILIIAAAGALFGGTSVHRREHSSNGKETELRIVRDDDDRDYATWNNDGTRYITYDEGVIDALLKASQRHSEVSRQHAELGRRHAELGREHAALGREIAGVARSSPPDAAERQKRLQLQQKNLERRQQDLQRQQQALAQRHNLSDTAVDQTIDEIFQRAVREGKAKRK